MREESSGKLGASGGKSMLDGQEAEAATEAETASIFHSSNGLGGRGDFLFSGLLFGLLRLCHQLRYGKKLFRTADLEKKTDTHLNCCRLLSS